VTGVQTCALPILGAILILEEVFGVLTPEELRGFQTYSLQEET
jgi:hypothetical protein